MKSIVIYRSKTGFAKRYAEWIAEELKADLVEGSKVTGDKLQNYDNVIYGGGLYAVGINGVKLIKKNLSKLHGKKIAVFATGATPPRDEDINAVRDMNFTPEEQKQIRFFYMRGGFDYSKLNLLDKLLMTLLKLKLRSKKNPVADERGMLNAYSKPVDFVQRKNIEKLVSYIKM